MSMRLGANTYSWIWSTPMPECVRALRALGFTDFELMVNPPHLSIEGGDAAQRRRLSREFEHEGIVLRSLNMPSLDINLASAMKVARDYSIDVMSRAIRLAADLSIQRVLVVPGRMSPLFPPPMASRMTWMRESIETLIPIADRHGVGLVIENVPFASFPDAVSLGAFVRSIGSSTLSVCYDAANAHFIGESTAEGVRELDDLLSLVHLSDTTTIAWRHDEVGLGDVPFEDTFSALAAIGFDGPCMMEVIAAQEPEQALLRSHDALVTVGFASGLEGPAS